MWFVPAKDPVPALDLRFERFREALAEAFIEDERAGFLSVRLEPYFTAAGPWWRRRWVNPEWGVDWLLAYEEEVDRAHPRDDRPPFDDGLELNDLSVFDELLAGEINLRGVVYSLRWIDRTAEPELWAENFALASSRASELEPAGAIRQTPAAMETR